MAHHSIVITPPAPAASNLGVIKLALNSGKRWFVERQKNENPESFCSKNIKLQEFDVMASIFFSRAQLVFTL